MTYNILEIIGDMAGYEFILITVLSFTNDYKLIIVYLFGILLNHILNNNILGYIFKKYNKQFERIIPSGHFQSMAYSFIFYILTHTKQFIFNNKYILYLYAFITLCTFYNCIKFKYHTIIDIISGIIFGFLFGYSYVNFSKLILKNM
jgi:membrane-associated phospholipid phosphatase